MISVAPSILDTGSCVKLPRACRDQRRGRRPAGPGSPAGFLCCGVLTINGMGSFVTRRDGRRFRHHHSGLSNQLSRRRARQPQFPHNDLIAAIGSQQLDDSWQMLGILARPSQRHPTLLSRTNACVDPFHDQILLELRYRPENVQLKVSHRVAVGGVDALRGANQRRPVGLQLSDHLRQMRQRTCKSIQLERHDGADLASAYHAHEPVQPGAAGSTTGDAVRDLLDILPAPALAVCPQLLQLGIGRLIDGRDAGVNNDDSFAHKLEVARLKITLAAFQWANDCLEPG